MPCGCNKQTVNGQWVYTDQSGRKQVFNSEIKAKEAQVLAGGTGTVRPR